MFTNDGTGYFSTIMLNITALAPNSIILNATTTANQIVFTSDFATNQKEIVETIERLMGEKWERKSIGTNETIPALKSAWKNGDAHAGHGLINICFTEGSYSGHFEPSRYIWNQELNLPMKMIEEVVKEALGELSHPKTNWEVMVGAHKGGINLTCPESLFLFHY